MFRTICAAAQNLPGLVCICLLSGLLGAMAHGATPPATIDYLTPDLRARVEKLKADFSAETSNPTIRQERARVLWDWANAYALEGGVLPVNLTQAVAAVFAYPDLIANQVGYLDAFIVEMSLRDEDPSAIGTLKADLGPFEARSFVTIHQTYTVGSRQIQTGGGFLVARHFMPNYGRWQTEDVKADNYISVSTSNARASFSTDTAPMAGMHGGFRSTRDTLVFRLASGTLEPNDTVTITYGDTSQGSRGFLMADFSSDRMPLPLYLAFNQTGPFMTLPIQPIRVSGTTVAGVHGFAPSIVATGEPFTLSVRAEDRFYNRAIDGHPAWRVALNGKPFREIPASDAPITLLSNIRLDEPGVYRFTIANADGSIQGVANPILARENPGDRIYWGDTHGHSGFAEGIGTPDRFMTWAKEDARLDYVTHSEHDIWLDDYEWEVLRDNVTRYSVEGEFIGFLGYEWTVRNFQGGHHNVLYRTAERRDRVPVQFYPTLSKLYAGLRAGNDSRDVLIIPHAHQAGDYRQNDPELEPLVEIMSQHGNFEWFGRMYLNHGHQIGFVAASDNHLSQPGYSAPKSTSLAQRGGLGAVLAPQKTRDEIFDAMKSLKVYATTGERMIVEFALNGIGMGQRAPFSTTRSISGRVIGTAPIDTITLLKNDQEIWQQDYLTPQADRSRGEDSFLLSFASPSDPHHPGDNPRGWRIWRGTVEILNASLSRATGSDFHNHATQSLRIDSDNANLIHFATLSRGDASSIALDLADVKRSTQIRINLESARETGGAPPLYRPPKVLEAAEILLAVRDLERGRTQQVLRVDDYEDTVTLRRVISDGEMDVSFTFEDEGERQGDYYFIRVKQVNDSLAWSSPIWVGGYAEK